MIIKFPTVYLLAALSAIVLTPAQAAVQRAFVASYGLNSNTAFNCDVAHPCRQFLAAVTVVNPNGEVVALDTAAYGAVTITQSISLTAAPGAYAGITTFPGANGVTIATPGVNVVLRGLTINSQGGDAGILMTAGAKLSIEDCVISNFSIPNVSNNQYGVFIDTPATVRVVNTLIRDNDIGIQIQDGATADISGSKFFGNSTAGIVANTVLPSTTTTAAVSDTVVVGSGIGIYAIASTNATASSKIEITRSIVSNSGLGVTAESQSGAVATVSIRKSMVTESTTGLAQVFSGSLITYGNNTLSNNTNNTGGTITTASAL